ncbi:TetR family transcriptional regulator [Sorangium cellulosum]|uniref:TetR family transcriptional regulator n=1 Tax=Sorangium cellulosum TaxID=56 RepID=A0A2L0EHX6_SORCE|nr:TetR/AcrR family transcriptional regulator [Sorangium cellulosum]AUX38893.1 TetR family transcriptional regulator [Sorangium cellulosum]
MAVARQSGVARREALLDAALRCFAERGLLRTGIEDVRKAAGASPSSVYHLFEDFPALVAALLERTFERMAGYMTARVLAERTARAAVRTLVEAHLTWVFDHEAEARFMYQALALELDGHHRAALRDTKARLKAEMMAHMTELGVFSGAGSSGSSGSSEVMFDVVLLGPAHQACRVYLSASGAVDPAWMRAMLPELACGALAAVEPAARAARRGRRGAGAEPAQKPGGRRKSKAR